MGIVYDKFRGAWLDRDAETYMSCLHTEYEFHLHSNGRKITIANYDVDRILNFMTESEQLHPTCIYENEEILVEHFYTVATDGSCECLSPLELCQYILAKGVRKHGSKALF